MRLLIAAVVWVGAVAGAVALSSAVASSIHNPPSQTASAGSGSATGGTGAPSPGSAGSSSVDPSSITSTDPRSLFRTVNFTKALATVRSHIGAGAKLDLLALYPGYMSLTQVVGGSERDVYIAFDGAYMLENTGGSAGGSPVFALSRVAATVPAALAARIATAGHTPVSQLNYMVAQVDPADNRFRWLVYPHQGNRVEYYEASGATGPLLEYLTNSSTGLQPVR